MLSLLLRTAPAALLLRSDDLLLGGRKYSGPTRLPLLLWLINQTARWVLVPVQLLAPAVGTSVPICLLLHKHKRTSEFQLKLEPGSARLQS